MSDEGLMLTLKEAMLRGWVFVAPYDAGRVIVKRQRADGKIEQALALAR